MQTYAPLILSARTLTASIYDVPNNYTFIDDDLYCLSLIDYNNALCKADLSSDKPTVQLVLSGLRSTSMTKEEELLRERMRQAVTGITSYSRIPNSNLLLLPGGNSIYMYNTTSKELKEITKRKGSNAKLDVKSSPDGKFISYIEDNELYVMNMKTQTERQITKSPAKHVTSGVAEYIMQEEFDRFTGYWWSPRSNQIAYLEVDEREVPEVKIPQAGYSGDVDVYKYPRVGEKNAKSTLCIATFDDNLQNVEIEKFEGLIEKSFPWCEYIVRVGWTPSNTIWLQLLNRLQDHSAFVEFDLSSKEFTIIHEEKTDYWINVGDLTYFFKDGSNRVIIGSEKSGFNQLYLFQKKNKRYELVKQLTRGDWVVMKKQIWVDEKNDFIYFIGTRESPLERHVYRTSISNTDDITLITQKGYFYENIAFNETLDSFCCSYSNIHSHPVVSVYKCNDKNEWSQFKQIDFGFQEPETSFKLTTPELFSFKNKHGDIIHGVVYKPVDYENKKYPCVLYVYGGPGPQLVVNNYSLYTNGRLQLLQSLGYIVVNIDGRGSNHRGIKFEGILKHKMGQVELDDQIEGIEYLINNNVANIDKNRIAVTGWSYGGYLSLMAIGQRSDFFKLCIAGAPVTDWVLYDTGYTERYMGLPENNEDGYKYSNVLTYAKNFPNDFNRVLIFHGSCDENVHFKHTEVLINELIKCGKHYQLQLYPSERHGIRGGLNYLHYNYIFIRFLEQNLK